jgi:hypothetical protein
MIDPKRIVAAGLLALLAAPLSGPPEAAAQESRGERWKMSAEFSFTDQSGNRALRLLTGGLNLSHLRRQDFRLDSSLRSRYGRSEGDLVALNHQGTLALDLQPTATWSPFLFMDAERDELKRLDLRLSTGAGAKHTFRRTETGTGETSLSLALLHAYERIGPADAAAGALPVDRVEITHAARWSLRGRTSHELRDGVTFRHTTFYQPVWDELADYLLRSDTGFKILLTERLALSIEYQLKRNARPPAGIEPTDRLLTTGLIIDF